MWQKFNSFLIKFWVKAWTFGPLCVLTVVNNLHKEIKSDSFRFVRGIHCQPCIYSYLYSYYRVNHGGWDSIRLCHWCFPIGLLNHLLSLLNNFGHSRKTELNVKTKFILQNYFISCRYYSLICGFRSQTTQTVYLLSQGGLRRPIVDPARHATFLQ